MYQYSTKMSWLQNRIFAYTIRISAYFNFILIMFHDLYLACILQNVTQHCNLISNGRHYMTWPYLVEMFLCNLYCVLCLYQNNIVKRNILCIDYKIGLRPWQWVTSQGKTLQNNSGGFVYDYLYLYSKTLIMWYRYNDNI
jgi:hypothetical protein